jgi:ATP-binding cassette subfamily C protein
MMSESTRSRQTGEVAIAHALGQFIAAVLRTSPRLAAAAAALTFAVGLLEGAGLLLLIPLLQLVGMDAQQGAMGRVLQRFSELFSALGLTPTLPLVLGLYVAVVAVQGILQRQQSRVATRLRESIVDALRVRLYRAIASTKWVFFSRMRAATFGQMLTGRVDRVANAAYYLLDLFVTGVLALVYIAVALRVSPMMTAIVLACGALLAVALRGQLLRARRAGAAWTAVSTSLYQATFDHLHSLKIAKAYGAEERHASRFADLSHELGTRSAEATDASAQTRQWVTVGSALLLAVIVYVAQAVMGMSAAALFLLIFLFARLVPRLTSMYERAQILAVELPAFESVLEAEAECLDAAEQEPAAREPAPFTRSIECRNITFRYRDDDPPALDDVSLRIPARETTAIVGPSGAGKSTIADLLMGLVAPEAGSLLIDGQPLTPERLHGWREQIGYVSQDTLLFHDTVRANLLWANPSATEPEIWEALAQAAAAEFVQSLPNGLDTLVGDRGVLLSGGERQRLSLARALLRHPRVLILDEATSALDSENERRIQDAFERLHEQITIVVITHRLSTIRNADLIYVVDGGRIDGSGTWTALTDDRSSRFRALCIAQGIDLSDAASAGTGIASGGTGVASGGTAVASGGTAVTSGFSRTPSPRIVRVRTS